MRLKIGLAFFLVSSLLSVLLALSLYRFLETKLEAELRTRLRDITHLGSHTIDRPTYERLRAQVEPDLGPEAVAAVERSADFRRLSDELNRIRATEPDLVRFVYILEPTEDPDVARFVVDADVLSAGADEEISHFAQTYDVGAIPALARSLATCTAVVENDFVLDAEFGVRSVSAYVPLGGGAGSCRGVLGVDITDTKMRAVLNEARQLALLISLAVIALALLVSALVATFLTRPILALNATVQRFAAKDFAARTDVRTHDEIGQLARNFDGMAESLQAYSENLEELVALRTRELHAEKQTTDRLLLNVLPAPIAERLKKGAEIIVDRFDDVTVLFADIVGFTSLSSRTSPEALVSMLDELFTEFDRLAEKHGLEKIKTIGDAYMVVGGIPEPRPDHTVDVARMAIDMHTVMRDYSVRNDVELSVRIGINTGSVVAGVIGKKKFIYDLWGDAVNTASRMESHGVPGKIHVTEATYLALRDRFDFEPRGTMEIKGKGVMPTYLLVREKPVRELPRESIAS